MENQYDTTKSTNKDIETNEYTKLETKSPIDDIFDSDVSTSINIVAAIDGFCGLFYKHFVSWARGCRRCIQKLNRYHGY